MTFLPIVERELRVATRKRFTYWLRVMAAAALLSGNSLFGPHLGGRMFARFHFTLLLCIWVLGRDRERLGFRRQSRCGCGLRWRRVCAGDNFRWSAAARNAMLAAQA